MGNDREKKSEPRARVELCCHTNIGSAGAVNKVEDLIRRASRRNQPAVAITDKDVVHAFPKAAEAGEKYEVKIIYGAEIRLAENKPAGSGSKDKRGQYVKLLARTQNGLKNLYKLISLSHTEYFDGVPQIPESLLEDCRDGLLVGAFGFQGELYQSLQAGESEAEIKQRLAFYDYIEIHPVDLIRAQFEIDFPEMEVTAEEIKRWNSKLYELAREVDKPVVASGRVFYLDKDEHLGYRILSWFRQQNHNVKNAPFYYRTTGEMLDCFEFLGEKQAREVVVENPGEIAEHCEKIKPIPDGFYPPTVKNARDKLNKYVHRRARELYGEKPPEFAANRLQKEMETIRENKFESIYLIARQLVDKITEDGYPVRTRGTAGSSFVAFLSGITDINPLQAHYRCPQCCETLIPDDCRADIGLDLAPGNCPKCGVNMKREGFNIPFEIFGGLKGEKIPEIHFNLPGEYKVDIFQHSENIFGSRNIFRAGIVTIMSRHMAENIVSKFWEEHYADRQLTGLDRLAEELRGAKISTTCSSGVIFIVPEERSIYEFCPLNYPGNDSETELKIIHFNYPTLKDHLLHFNIVGTEDLMQLSHLQQITSFKPSDVPLSDEQTLRLFTDITVMGIEPGELGMKTGLLGIPDFSYKYALEMVNELQPASFLDLVRVNGLLHGAGVWTDNAEELFKDKVVSLRSMVTCRADLMDRLLESGISREVSFQIMEDISNRRGLNKEQKSCLIERGLPEWFIEFCEDIEYIFPKAFAIFCTKIAFQLAYYKLHYPAAFYANYFTLASESLKAEYLFSPEKRENRLIELKEQTVDRIDAHVISIKKFKEYIILLILKEADLRGVRVLRPRRGKSDPNIFQVEGENKIRAPLNFAKN